MEEWVISEAASARLSGFGVFMDAWNNIGSISAPPAGFIRQAITIDQIGRRIR